MYVSTFLVAKTESLAGWLYFACWSLSFYPQIYLNYNRKTIEGLSFDYIAINVLGFAAYSIYTFLLYAVPEVNEAFGSSPPEIDLSDLFFALHGLLCTLVIVVQCIIYPRNGGKVRCHVASMCMTLGTLIVFGPLAASFDAIDWKSYVNFCGSIKFFSSFSKNLPQVLLNCSRQSTDGFSFNGIAIHFIGAVFSLLQQALQAYLQNSFAPFTSNLPKTCLAMEAIMFDVIFTWQHIKWYDPHKVLFKQARAAEFDGADALVLDMYPNEHQPLIAIPVDQIIYSAASVASADSNA